MKKFSRLLLAFILATMSSLVVAQFYYGNGEAVNLEERIRFNQTQTAIETGTLSLPTGGLGRPVGSLYLNITDGIPRFKTDAGTNDWRLVSDKLDTFNLYTDPGFKRFTTVGDEILCGGSSSATRSVDTYGPEAGSALFELLFGQNCTHLRLTSTTYPTGSPLTISGYWKATNLELEICPVIGSTIVTGDCVKPSAVNTWEKFYFLKSSSSLDGYAVRCADLSCENEFAYTDSVFLGVDQTRNLQPISESQNIGKLRYTTATNCVWGTTSATFADFVADADCATPIATGKIEAPVTKIPQFTIKNARTDGVYNVRVSTYFNTGGGATGDRCSFSLTSDSQRYQTTIIRGQGDPSSVLSGSFKYTTSGDKIVKIQGIRNTGTTTCSIVANIESRELVFDIDFEPDASTLVGKDFCADPRDCETVFSAAVSSTGVVSNENLNWIEGNATIASTSNYSLTYTDGLFNEPPNCFLTINQNGALVSYFITGPSATGSTNRIVSSTIANPTASDFRISCQRSGQDYINAKVRNIVGNFEAKNLRGGVDYGSDVKMIAGYASFGGASDGDSCISTPCNRYNQKGVLGSNMSLTRSALGTYELTINGIKEGTRPFCSCISESSGTRRQCDFLVPSIVSSGTSTTSLLTVSIASTGHAAVDSYLQIKCEGEAP